MFASNHPWRALWRPLCRLTLASSCAAVLLAACGGGSDPVAAGDAAPLAAVPQTQPRAAAAPHDIDNGVSSVRTDGKASRADSRYTNKVYIVQLAEEPVAGYRGTIRGLAATRPARGHKIDSADPAVSAYRSYLQSRHDKLVRAVGGRKLYSYAHVFNGFSAELSDEQAQQLRATKGVLSVTKDRARHVTTASTPAFLGLSGDTGFWNQTGATGDGVIIGLVDGGVWPESPSFSDEADANGVYTPGSGSTYPRLARWHGLCEKGEEFRPSMCNGKLIGARHYNAAWGGDAGIDARMPHEYNSPRDWGGHGTHTSSTAGGNRSVPITGPAALFGSVNGMAPRARIAMYKTCWDDGSGGTCFESDSMAAIDQAVADGVDVINMSVGGSNDSSLDPVELSFMYAADAGVFVAVSAGNDGPTPSTVEHPSPWLTTVAAGTHNRMTQATVTLGNSNQYTGASLNFTNVPATALIDAKNAGLPGANPTKVALCFTAADNADASLGLPTATGPVLDPAKITGKIVVCDRGSNARVNKSAAVLAAGGVGMILINPTTNSLNNDFHSVPTVHLQATDYTAVKNYADTADSPTGAIPVATVLTNVDAPFQADFSSRGPTLAAGGNLLKPDITAPGVDVLAAVAPPGNSGRSFDIYSGTSMASPHIAGIAALFKQAKPSWTPMMIKSALMTTASDVLGGSNTDATYIFGQGAGHVQPKKALDPGLVFDSSFLDWLGYLCATDLGTDYCDYYGIPIVQPVDVNVASLAAASIAGSQSLTRYVTNVGASGTYTPHVDGMSGFTVDVQPPSLYLAAGQTKSFTVTLTRNGATLNAYAGGQLTWSDGTHTVRLPMVARPVALKAPVEVTGSYSVKFGYSGSFTVTPRGLVAAAPSKGSVATDKHVDIPITVPAGTTYARFALFDADVSVKNADLDLEVYRNGALVGLSGTATATERVSLRDPTPGTYVVRVIGYDTRGKTAKFTLSSWLLGSADAGNLKVAATSTATVETTAGVTLQACPRTAKKVNPAGHGCTLQSGVRYLGSVVYGGASGMPPPTIVFLE
ncbi:MAG TPA: S8 family peptidase [Ramlibacter sp.]|uniref:S8 family peptidase n=1 Tax=Ramlibacter sp. TaxID=1917967 RepID=UPI002CA39074|nr:S8 family peptidase [Ramlibacter sp.]HVZ45280.1 S8 family peptidase [Ramlibacter sp.]